MDSRRAGPGLGPTLWLMGVIGALLFGGFYLWSRDTRRGSVNPELSTARADDRGAALLFRLYESAGLKPEAWDEDLGHLKQPGLLFLLAPTPSRKLFGEIEVGREGDFLPDEIRALDDWVKQGNVVVIMARDRNDLFHTLGLIVDEPKQASGKDAEPAQPSLLAQGVSALSTRTAFGFKFGRVKAKNPLTGKEFEEDVDLAPFPPVPAEQWVTLFRKKEGQRAVPQVVSAARGKGLYVAVNDWFPASNLGLTMSDNARFMLNLARLRPAGGGIWFDEFHKRNVERNLVGYFRERQLLPAVAYVLLLLGLLFWRTGTRFGDPQPLVADRRRDSGEYIRALAQLYRNARMTREALAALYEDFRRRLAGALRMDGLTDLEEVGRRYEMRSGRPAVEARQALVEAEAVLTRDRLTEAEALQFCQRLAHIDAALQGRGGLTRREGEV